MEQNRKEQNKKKQNKKKGIYIPKNNSFYNSNDVKYIGSEKKIPEQFSSYEVDNNIGNIKKKINDLKDSVKFREQEKELLEKKIQSDLYQIRRTEEFLKNEELRLYLPLLIDFLKQLGKADANDEYPIILRFPNYNENIDKYLIHHIYKNEKHGGLSKLDIRCGVYKGNGTNVFNISYDNIKLLDLFGISQVSKKPQLQIISYS